MKKHLLGRAAAAVLAFAVAGGALPALTGETPLIGTSVSADTAAPTIKVGDTWYVGDTANFGEYWYTDLPTKQRGIYNVQCNGDTVTIPQPQNNLRQYWLFPFVLHSKAVYNEDGYWTSGNQCAIKIAYGSNAPIGIKIVSGSGTMEDPFVFGPVYEASAVPVTKIEFTSEAAEAEIGEYFSLGISLTPENAEGGPFIWSSDNEDVVEVYDGNKLQALSAGTANITVTATNGTDDTSDDVSATCAVTVKAAYDPGDIKPGKIWNIGDTAYFGNYWYRYDERLTDACARHTGAVKTIPSPVFSKGSGSNSGEPVQGSSGIGKGFEDTIAFGDGDCWRFDNIFSYVGYANSKSTDMRYCSSTGIFVKPKYVNGTLVQPCGIQIKSGSGTLEDPFVLGAAYDDTSSTLYTVTVSAEGNGRASSSIEACTEGKAVNINAYPGQNYHFKEWQVISGGVALESTTDADTYFYMGSENVEIRAVFEKDIFIPDKPTPWIKAVFGGRTVTLFCENDPEADIYYQFGSSNITSSCAHIKSGETIFIDTPKTGKDAALYFKAYNGKWSALGKWGVLNVQIAKPLITQSGKKAENKFKIYTQTKDSYIVYTLNGSVPSIEEGVQKLKVKNGRLVWGTSAVIEVPKGRTVKAIAIRSGLVTSDVMTYTNS